MHAFDQHYLNYLMCTTLNTKCPSDFRSYFKVLLNKWRKFQCISIVNHHETASKN